MKHFCPFILKDSPIDSFDLADNIRIRRIEQSEREEFFGLKEVNFSFSNVKLPGYIGFEKLVSSERKGRANYEDIFKRGIFDGSSDILATNYILEMDLKDSPDFLINDVDLAFKIFKPCSTGLCLNFREKETDVSFSGLSVGPFLPYIGIGDKKDLLKIKYIYQKILENKKDSKFQIISELYRDALSGIPVDLKLRFILLVVLLESLCLSGSKSESTFKFSLRLSKLLSKYYELEIEKQFKFAEEIYDIRSKIVHSGKNDGLNGDVFLKTIEIVKLLINLYLDDSDIFKKENLKKIALR